MIFSQKVLLYYSNGLQIGWEDSMSESYKTEKELLKNSQKDDYMSDKQLSFFENRLKHDKDALLKSISSSKEEIAMDDDPSDEIDGATYQESRIRNLRLIERQTKLLHKVEDAIDRIHSGEFGFCSKTGEEIGLPRLLARPTATLSIEAKESQESHERTEAD